METGTNEGSQVPPPEERPTSPVNRIYRYTATAISPYREVLISDAEDEKVSDLGRRAKELLGLHLGQLDTLKTMLKEYLHQPDKFRQYVRLVKVLEERINERETFTARFGPKNERIPVGPEKPQVQLSFHGNISAQDPETIAEALYHLGMSRPPDKAIASLFSGATEQMVEFNTVGVYIDPDSEKNKVIPHAGISFRWKRGENKARVGGIVFIGHQVHSMELLKSIPLVDFLLMQRTVMDLAGYKPKKERSGPGGK